jgi:hypothetical protein
MTMTNDFAIFILSHGRPDKIYTLKALKASNYTGKYYIIIDDEDKTADRYKELYREKVIQFNKSEIASRTEEADNFNDKRAIIYARNACFEIAKKLNIKYFMQLDDDYTGFRYTADENWLYLNKRPKIKDLNRTINIMLDFYKSTSILAIAMSQGGDYIGGENSSVFKKRLARKAMNSFLCSTERPFKFVGRVNEDVNTYTWLQSIGGIFFTFARYRLEQKQTQSNSGGMTEMYLDSGTYIKSFYTVMFQPSSVKIRLMGNNQKQANVRKRLHHHIDWLRTAPKIISEDYNKLK